MILLLLIGHFERQQPPLIFFLSQAIRLPQGVQRDHQALRRVGQPLKICPLISFVIMEILPQRFSLS